MALYVKDENGDDILDDNGDNIEYTIDDHSSSEDLTYNTTFSLNDDGHVETDKNIIAKAGTEDNHVVIKSQVGNIVRDSFIDLWVSEYLRMYSSGNCEEELPKKPVGRLSVNCRPTVGRLLPNCRPTVGRLLADSWATVGRLSANSRPTVVQLSADSLCYV